MIWCNIRSLSLIHEGNSTMQVSSANIALTLLKGLGNSISKPEIVILPKTDFTASGSSENAKQSAAISDADQYPDYHTMREASDKFLWDSLKGLSEGSKSPFDAEINAAFGEEKLFRQHNSKSALKYEGSYSAEIVSTQRQTAPQRDANFLSRQDAMAYAYHFGISLAREAQAVVASKPQIDASKDSTGRMYGTNPSGHGMDAFALMDESYRHDTHGIVLNMKSMETSAAALGRLFSFDSASVTISAYDGKFNGFSISHGEMGKVMDVADDGSITLYDANGTSYSSEDYNSANVDGGIPQLHNDIIRKTAKIERRLIGMIEIERTL